MHRHALAVVVMLLLASGEARALFWSVNALDKVALLKRKVTFAVVRVSRVRVVKERQQGVEPDGTMWFTFGEWAIDYQFVEHIFGPAVTHEMLRDVHYTDSTINNVAYLASPKAGEHVLMTWIGGHPCGSSSGVALGGGPDLPTAISGPDDPRVAIVKSILELVMAGRAEDSHDLVREFWRLSGTRYSDPDPLASGAWRTWDPADGVPVSGKSDREPVSRGCMLAVAATLATVCTGAALLVLLYARRARRRRASS